MWSLCWGRCTIAIDGAQVQEGQMTDIMQKLGLELSGLKFKQSSDTYPKRQT